MVVHALLLGVQNVWTCLDMFGHSINCSSQLILPIPWLWHAALTCHQWLVCWRFQGLLHKDVAFAARIVHKTFHFHTNQQTETGVLIFFSTSWQPVKLEMLRGETVDSKLETTVGGPTCLHHCLGIHLY